MDSLKVVTLSNSKGLELLISNYGATIIGLKVPDRDGKLTNVVVGLDSPQDYLGEPYIKTGLFLGSSIGRYAGRISGGSFRLENERYSLYAREGIHLHGGEEGFDKKIWTIEKINNNNNNNNNNEPPSVTLVYFSKHLEEGYPGNLKVCVTYELLKSNSLKITYKAKTDRLTHVNLTNHSYFNLDGKGSILDHKLQINSNYCLELDEQLIPTGKLFNSENTRFDYIKKSKIGRTNFAGLDDAFVLNEEYLKASLSSFTTGIQMNVYSNQLAMIIHTPKLFDELPFRNAVKYSKFPAICFETQNFPDAPNNAHFPSSKLKPDKEYMNETIFEFNIIA